MVLLRPNLYVVRIDRAEKFLFRYSNGEAKVSVSRNARKYNTFIYKSPFLK